MLEACNISKHFGGLTALNNLSFSLNRGEILGLIGPNGAGKSTLFNVITGFVNASSGKILFKGEKISTLKPFQIVSKGISRTFQHNIIFPELTALENVLLGCHLNSSISKALFSIKRFPDHEIKHAIEILEFLNLKLYMDNFAADLPHGYQQILKVAIALGSNPELMLLDEPVSGMNQDEMDQMERLIRELPEKRGLTIILVEHNMRAVMGLCQRIVVIDAGCKIAEGSPDEIRRNKDVIEAYLGKDNSGNK